MSACHSAPRRWKPSAERLVPLGWRGRAYLTLGLCAGLLATGGARALGDPGGPTALKKSSGPPPVAQRELEFPGPLPGAAKASAKDGWLVLENNVIAARWHIEGDRLRPAAVVNRLASSSFDQTGKELFRVALKPDAEPRVGCQVGVRLEPDRVVALASSDGLAWSELAAFPRAGLAGDPRLVRLGKMNLRAESKDYAGPAGAAGQGSITEVNPLPASLPSARFDFKTEGNRAATTEFAFPQGTKLISCRIDKGTDQGLSWSPALALVWEEGKRFVLVGVRRANSEFNVTTVAGETIVGRTLSSYPAFDLPASAFRLDGAPKLVRLAPRPEGTRVVDRKAGSALEANLLSDSGLQAHWRAELRDGSSYVRQTVEFCSPDKTIPLFAVELGDWQVAGAKTMGTAPGCPVAAGGMFFGVEMPGAQNAVDGAGARIGFGCQLEVSPAQSYPFGSVAGVAPEGQLRRAFLFYLERERARPSRPFLHYNCWYDLGFSVDAEKMLDVVRRFNEELVHKRGVPVQSYLVDDGWDDPDNGLWLENQAKFPGGFGALKTQMDKLDAHLAIWISPLGGYGGQAEREADARKLGLIPLGAKLDLAYPGYKLWFQQRCRQLMREDGVNAFKWDRAGEGVSPHFMALLDVARSLRQPDRDLFINVTVGTWPSPFWLNHVDSTWRNGSADVGWDGKGDDREKWLTFRDGNCRRYFVERSPLYPLNSVMHHGIVQGRCFQGERVGKAGPNLRNEVRSYFANGAMLQELYVTPSMMTPQAWDDLADAARWAHTNADVLVDSHWVGGDPLKLEPYGYAAWNPRRGTLMLRNPDDKPSSTTIEAGAIFELPPKAPQLYTLRSPYQDQRLQSLELVAGRPTQILLEPFEVLVFDAKPHGR